MGRNRRHDIVKPSKYKTSMCSFFVSSEGCPFGANCAFAHGADELRVESSDNAPPEDATVGVASPSLAANATTALADGKASAAHNAAGQLKEAATKARGASGTTRSPSGGAGAAAGETEEVSAEGTDSANRDETGCRAQACGRQKGPPTGQNPSQRAPTSKDKTNGLKSRQGVAATPTQSYASPTGPVGGFGSVGNPAPTPGATFPGVPGKGSNGNSSGRFSHRTNGFLNLAEMPYSSNSAVPNAPLYIPTNMAQHPYFNINNSHQFLNVMLPSGAAASAGPVAGAAGSYLSAVSPAVNGAPYLLFGNGGAALPQGTVAPPPPGFHAATSSSSTGTNHRQTPKSTPTGTPHPPAAHQRGHVVSRNTLANAGHSRGGRNHNQQQQQQQQHHNSNRQRPQSLHGLNESAGAGGSPSSLTPGDAFAPFSPGVFGLDGTDQRALAPGAPLTLSSSGTGPSLQSLFSSQAPPTVVRIPFDAPGVPWGYSLGTGAGTSSAGANSTATGTTSACDDFQSPSTPAQQLNSFLHQGIGSGYYAYTLLPNTCGLTQSQPLEQPQQSFWRKAQDSAGVVQTLSPENLLASLEQQEWASGGRGLGIESGPLGRRPSASEDDDANSEATDLSAFLESWLRQGSPSGGTDTASVDRAAATNPPSPAPATAAAKSEKVAPSEKKVKPEVAPALPATFTSGQLSTLRPVALPPSNPAVKLSSASTGPVPLANTATLASFTASTTTEVAPAARKRQLLCSVTRAGSYSPIAAAAEAAPADKPRTNPRGRRTPIMRNHFQSSCIGKEEEEQPAGASILLYSAEKNTLYYITAPGAAERKRAHAQESARAAADAVEAKGANPSPGNTGHSERHITVDADTPSLPNAGSGLEAGGHNSSGTSTDGTPGEVSVQKLVAGERIIRCRQPQKRYQYAEASDADDGMEYCI